MLDLLKARLRDPRTHTVLACMAVLGLTAWIGPMVGVKGEALRMLMSGQGSIGMLISYLLKTPRDADAHAKAKADADSAPSAEDVTDA